MYKFRLSLILLVCLASMANAQTVEEIQQKYIAALGGKSTLGKLKSSYQEATMDVMGMQMNAKMWVVYGTAMRQEVDIQGQKLVTFVSNEKGWMINPMMGSTTPQPLPEDALKGYMGALTPGGELAALQEKGFTTTMEGKEDVDGKPAYKIKLSKDSIQSWVYVDVASNYLVRTVIKTSAMGQELEVKTTFSDYKKTAEGFVYPSVSTISNPMMGDIKMTVTKFEVNKTIDVKALEQAEQTAALGML